MNLLHEIDRFQKEHEYPPSYRDLMRACDISSTAVVSYRLNKLVKEGLIARDAGVGRSIRLTDAGRAALPAWREHAHGGLEHAHFTSGEHDHTEGR